MESTKNSLPYVTSLDADAIPQDVADELLNNGWELVEHQINDDAA